MHAAAAERPAKHGHGRRLLLAGAALPFLPRFAKAAEITWRVGHNAPPDFPLHVRLVEAAGTIAARTEGRMQIEVYPNNELGGPIGLFAQVRSGAVDAAPLTSELLGGQLAVAALPMVGFAFPDYDSVWTAMDSGVGTFLREQLRERLGLEIVGRPSNFGFRHVTTSGRVVQAAEDLNGLRLRTPPEAEFVNLFKALKALPVAMSLPNLLAALRSHSVDGQESVLPLVPAAGLQQLQKVCSLTSHIWDGQWLCVSKKAWTSLPANLKEVVTAAFDETALHQRADSMNGEDGVRKTLEAAGMTFNSVSPESFRKALRDAGYYATWKKKVGEEGWAVLEKYTGRLG